MWDLSSLAQKAKDAAARIESEINDSVGYVDAGIATLVAATEASPASVDNNEKDYFKVEEEEVSFSESDVAPSEKSGEAIRDANSSKLFDVNGDWDQCEGINTKNDAISTLSCALAKINALERELKSLKGELSAVKAELKSCRVGNLELEQQVRDLTEENMSLKMNMTTKDTD
ncbi:hypothetical protein ACHAW6_005465 [Cyclotella cf. meneghiniana]